MFTTFCSENLKGREDFGELGLHGTVILNWFLKECFMMVCSRFFWLKGTYRGGFL
jgi:hypothetical protein